MLDKNSNIASLSDNIKQGFAALMKDVHTAMPGIIETFDPVTQTASVQPAIKRIFKATGATESILTPTSLPILINVPVSQPRGGGYSITFPIATGDECLLVFGERSNDIWHENGGVQTPGARRFHSLSDAVAFVGLSSIPNKIPNYDAENVQIRKDDATAVITIQPNRIDIDTTVEVQINSPAIKLTGASLTHNGVNVGDDHTHEGSATAPSGAISDTGVPT